MNRVKNSRVKNKDQLNIYNLSNKLITRMTMLGLLILALSISTIPAFAETENLSPYKQFNSGIPIDEIQCRDSKILLESPSGKPSCVNDTSVEKLNQRGFVEITTNYETSVLNSNVIESKTITVP